MCVLRAGCYDHIGFRERPSIIVYVCIIIIVNIIIIIMIGQHRRPSRRGW